MDDETIRILVAEDDEEMLELLVKVLREEGYGVVNASSGDEAIARLDDEPIDIVLTDIRMPGVDGMGVFRGAMTRNLHQPVILMTAFGSIESAVQAMKEGAYYYLAKPFNIEDLLETVAGAAERVRHIRAMELEPAQETGSFFPMVFRSRTMTDLLDMSREVASSNATVLITGSTGTGKEILARAIHDMSPRKDRTFEAVDCNAIPEALLESELFGHKRGAFTGAVSDKRGLVELADGGTLFLDEVGNLSAPVQAKLLRFLQGRQFRRVGEVKERSVDARVISATNRDLRELITEGSFREDLFYRLSVFPLEVPDLKDRWEDIPALSYHFIRAFTGGYQVEGIRSDALDLMIDYPWPGNVRQLENVIERAVILRKSGLIQPRDLPDEVVGDRDAGPLARRSLDDVERSYILKLLEDCDGNQSRAARILGINRRTLYRKLRKWGEDGTFDGLDEPGHPSSES